MINALIPFLKERSFQGYALEDDKVILAFVSDQSHACCPTCGVESRSVHSRYVRKVYDLPWAGSAVVLRLGVKKFYCRQLACRQQIFTERLAKEIPCYARRTGRLGYLMERMGLKVGASPACFLGSLMGICYSASTFLRLMHQSPKGDFADPEYLGVDD